MHAGSQKKGISDGFDDISNPTSCNPGVNPNAPQNQMNSNPAYPPDVRTRTFRVAIGLLLAAILFRWLGESFQSIALAIFLVTCFAVAVRLGIQASVDVLNRTCRYCRESLAASTVPTNAPQTIDRESEMLRAKLDAIRLEETAIAKQRASHQCSAEDLIRAESLRLLAEIELLRHESMPKTWAETCRFQPAFRSSGSTSLNASILDCQNSDS